MCIDSCGAHGGHAPSGTDASSRETLIRVGSFVAFPLQETPSASSALQEASSLAEKHSIETVKKALEAAKPRGFKESVEVALNLREVDLSVPKNRIDEEVVLPKGRGKEVKICVFASGELAV